MVSCFLLIFFHLFLILVLKINIFLLVSLPRSVLDQIVDLCEQYNVWLVMDNTYEHFDHINANNPLDDEESIPFRCSESDHVINIFSFSKGYSLAGFRVGYLTVSKNGRGPEMFQQMLKVCQSTYFCPCR